MGRGRGRGKGSLRERERDKERLTEQGSGSACCPYPRMRPARTADHEPAAGLWPGAAGEAGAASCCRREVGTPTTARPRTRSGTWRWPAGEAGRRRAARPYIGCATMHAQIRPPPRRAAAAHRRDPSLSIAALPRWFPVSAGGPSKRSERLGGRKGEGGWIEGGTVWEGVAGWVGLWGAGWRWFRVMEHVDRPPPVEARSRLAAAAAAAAHLAAGPRRAGPPRALHRQHGASGQSSSRV
jgi:hypothetical protein